MAGCLERGIEAASWSSETPEPRKVGGTVLQRLFSCVCNQVDRKQMEVEQRDAQARKVGGAVLQQVLV